MALGDQPLKLRALGVLTDTLEAFGKLGICRTEVHTCTVGRVQLLSFAGPLRLCSPGPARWRGTRTRPELPEVDHTARLARSVLPRTQAVSRPTDLGCPGESCRRRHRYERSVI